MKTATRRALPTPSYSIKQQLPSLPTVEEIDIMDDSCNRLHPSYDAAIFFCFKNSTLIFMNASP